MRVDLNTIQPATPATPRINSNRKALNAHLIDGIERVLQCANWLTAQGFTVLHAQAGNRNPRIEIAACRLCLRLEGVVHITERNFNQPTKRIWVARRFGCEVRWAENDTGHGFQ